MSRPVVITCAVTGGGPLSSRNRAPVTPDEIATASLEAAREGASIVHIHVRDPQAGKPSGEFSLYESVVEKIRASSVDVLLNLTTGFGARYVPDAADPKRGGPGSTILSPEQRCEHVLKLKPDICSLDMGSMNFGDTVFMNTPKHLEAIASMVRQEGVVPEIEVFEPGHIRLAKNFIERGILKGPGWFQLCLGIAWGSPADARTMQYLAEQLPSGCGWSGFGIGEAQFPMAAQAAILGGHVRVGMEDNLYLARGVPASNRSLVQRAVTIIEALGFRVASPSEARRVLNVASGL